MKVSKVSKDKAPRSSNERVDEPRLSMYSNPPGDELSLDEFETFAVGRLIVLRAIEKLRTQEYTKGEEDSKIDAYLDENLQWDSFSNSFYEGKRRDQISHFILRLAYCQNEDNRRWFLSHESLLFKHRLSKLSPSELLKFTQSNGLAFDSVSPNEKFDLEKMKNGCMELSQNKKGSKTVVPKPNSVTDFYKIPFAQALDLVSNRNVFLKGGYAYVPSIALTSIIVARFRTSLSLQLLHAKSNFENVKQDPRLAPLLNGVHRQYVGEDYTDVKGNGSQLTAENIDQVAQRSMPLCMRRLHTTLRKDHKLKHSGRQQYWLFLKGAGMSLDDNIKFMQNEFSKIMSVETFNKEHLYNIRHLYGKEGKRADYAPFSCLKIIMGSAPPPGEFHGCPFRHMDVSHLSSLLGTMNINGLNRDKILKEVKDNKFQVACQRHFEITHPDAMSKEINQDNVGNHPNAWTRASMEYHNLGKVKEEVVSTSVAEVSSSSAAAENETNKMED